MKTIWKFTTEIEDRPRLMLPAGARILSCALDRVDNLYARYFNLWAEVDNSAPREERRLRVIGTGHPLPNVGQFVGTIQDPPFVWHIYEEEA